jgi:hypothetical protein
MNKNKSGSKKTLGDAEINEILSRWDSPDVINCILFEHLKTITYDPDYISFFTGDPININTQAAILFNKGYGTLDKLLNDPHVLIITLGFQIYDYVTGLYKIGDALTTGENPNGYKCEKCDRVYTGNGGLQQHMKYDH